jgi:hypothetical protein
MREYVFSHDFYFSELAQRRARAAALLTDETALRLLARGTVTVLFSLTQLIIRRAARRLSGAPSL